MNYKRTLSAAALSGAIAIAALLGTTPQSSAESSAPFDAKQTEAIQGIVKGYLLQNPEVLKEAFAELKKREETATGEQRKKVLASFFKEDSPFSSGNAGAGKVTLVEFFDYNCGYCRKAFSTVLGLTETEKDFRIVFVELPVLSRELEIASEAAIASAKQGKYFAYHRAMMSQAGMISEEKIFKIAAEVGLDVAKLRTDMASDETKATLMKNRAVASYWSIEGTPAFLIGDEAIPGAPEELGTMLKESIGKIRKEGCSVC